jgi:copper oxidase (laccase) domain-containing protein
MLMEKAGIKTLDERQFGDLDAEQLSGIQMIDVHPSLSVFESNKLLGNTDPRFHHVIDVVTNRIRLAAKAGCERMVVMVPQTEDTVIGLEAGPIIAKKEGFRLWPENLQPTDDYVYDPNDPPYMADLPGDGLITTETGNGLMLNTGDCAAVALFDPRGGVLGEAHIGREGAILDIGPKVVKQMRRNHGTHPRDLIVHFGTSIAPESYSLTYLSEALRQEAWRDYIVEVPGGGFQTDIVGYAVQRLVECGVPGQNITRSTINVATHDNYFSFTEYKQHEADMPDGRNGFVAVMR